MLSRCYKKYDKNYSNYGGRGIKMCSEWRGREGFQNFYEWAINHGYKDNLSIDRIDVNGNYCPENCRWATMTVQQNNRRDNKNITFNGKTQTLMQWCNELNLIYDRVLARINVLGWTVEEAFTIPKLTNGKDRRRHGNI